MIYDIRTTESAKETLVNLTGILFEEWKTYETGDELADMIGSIADNIKLSHLIFKGTHITTSRNRCSDIEKYGLLGLDKIYNTEDSDFRKFLNENDVYINFEEKWISHKSEVIELTGISSRENRAFFLANRINDDFGTNIFLCMPSYTAYETGIHTRPELLMNIDQVFATNLSELWIEQSKSYRVEVEVRGDMLSESISANSLIDYAWSVAVDGIKQFPLSLETNEFIPKENIVEIAEF